MVGHVGSVPSGLVTITVIVVTGMVAGSVGVGVIGVSGGWAGVSAGRQGVVRGRRDGVVATGCGLEAAGVEVFVLRGMGRRRCRGGRGRPSRWAPITRGWHEAGAVRGDDEVSSQNRGGAER
jgi:hypothetical protein